jgi:hypothetical protein
MRIVLVAIAVIWAPPAAAHLSRPTNREPEPLQYDLEDTVLSFSRTGGRFQIHYVVAGRNGIGAENLDGNATIDRVERIAEAYEEALAVFTSTLAFDPPPADADEFLDVYVLDTGPVAGGPLIEQCPAETPLSCESFILHPISTEDDLLFAKRAVFRAIVYGYRSFYDFAFEVGTAWWAAGDDSFATEYLGATDRTLGDATVVPDGGISALLFHLDDPALVRELWIDIADSRATPDWKELLDRRLGERGSSLGDEYATFAVSLADRVPIAEAPGELELAPLSARYFAVDTELEGEGLTQAIAGDVLVVVNPTLDPIVGTTRGCICSGGEGSPWVLLGLGAFALVLGIQRKGAKTQRRKG